MYYFKFHVTQSSCKWLKKCSQKRFSKISSSRNISETSKSGYEKVIKGSGYNTANLNYRKHSQTSKQNRNRNTIWFNPPFNKNVVTIVAQNGSLIW